MVLDCYWHFASVGDHYLGRVLAGFDPNCGDFDKLPPHWTMVDPITNTDIKKGMDMMFGRLLVLHPDSIPLLLRTFACFVFHSDSLRVQMLENSGHDFNKIMILQTPNRDLLSRLKLLVTVDPTEGVMTVPTGIPPHINQNRDMREVLDILKVVKTNQENQVEEIKKSIHDAFEDRALENGNPTNSSIQALLTNFQERQQNELKDRFDKILERLEGSTAVVNNTTAAAPSQQHHTPSLFSYDGHFYSVPNGFVFPALATLKEGLGFWLFGMDVANNKRVVPFRKLKPIMIPSSLKNTFKLNWKPIFVFLEKHVLIGTETITTDNINTYYNACIVVLKNRLSFCFKKKDGKCLSWAVSTWSKNVLPSYILKCGNDSDKELITSVPTNNSCQQQKRKTTPNSLVRHRHRQARRLNNDTSTTTNTPTTRNRSTTITTPTTRTRNDTTSTTTTTTTTDNEVDDNIPAPSHFDDDDNADTDALQIMEQYDQEEVNAFYSYNTDNIHEQERLTRMNDAPRRSTEWWQNKRDERTVQKLEKERVAREQYLIRKYDEDVILRWKPVADTRNRKESRLNNNGTFSLHNHQLATDEMAEMVRVREQNRTTTTTTVNTNPVLCCAGKDCGMDNSPLTSADFHKCNTCSGRLHGFLCCVESTFNEHTGTGKCKRCALPS